MSLLNLAVTTCWQQVWGELVFPKSNWSNAGQCILKRMLKSPCVSLDDWSLERYGLIWNLLTERAVGGFYRCSNFSCLEKERKRGKKNLHVILSLDLGLQILLSWSILGVKQSLDSSNCVVRWETSSQVSVLWYWEKRWPSLDHHEWWAASRLPSLVPIAVLQFLSRNTLIVPFCTLRITCQTKSAAVVWVSSWLKFVLWLVTLTPPCVFFSLNLHSFRTEEMGSLHNLPRSCWGRSRVCRALMGCDDMWMTRACWYSPSQQRFPAGKKKKSQA